MEDTGEGAPNNPQILALEQRLELIKKINEIVRQTGKTGISSIGVDAHGKTPSTQIAEFALEQEALDVSDAKPNDVIWWRTKNSNNYLFVADNAQNGIWGSFQSERNDGRKPRSYDSVRFDGAEVSNASTLGGQIRKNLPTRLSFPRKPNQAPGDNPIISSSRVVEMGIIRSEQLNQPIPTP